MPFYTEPVSYGHTRKLSAQVKHQQEANLVGSITFCIWILWMSKEKSAFLHQNNSHTNSNLKQKNPTIKKKGYKNKQLVLLEAGNLSLLQTDEILQFVKAELQIKSIIIQ